MLDPNLHYCIYCILSVQTQRLENQGVKSSQGVKANQGVENTVFTSFRA